MISVTSPYRDMFTRACNTVRVRYRPQGRGQQARLALVRLRPSSARWPCSRRCQMPNRRLWLDRSLISRTCLALRSSISHCAGNRSSRVQRARHPSAASSRRGVRPNVSSQFDATIKKYRYYNGLRADLRGPSGRRYTWQLRPPSVRSGPNRERRDCRHWSL
jgi:hypothetical protein